MTDLKSGWFGVRCIFDHRRDNEDPASRMYEERITIWQADDADAAIALAEADAEKYASTLDLTFLGLTQSYEMFDEVGPSAEVFSLIRSSNLGYTDYLNRFFDTGRENQNHWSPPPTDGTPEATTAP
jgi:hypothetical protein